MAITIKGLFFLLYCTNKVAAFIQGTDIRITCSVSGTLPTWDKDGTSIANEGSATINTADFPRITYDTDQSTLLLSTLASGDAGTYTCSFSGGGSGTFTVTVEVVTITDDDCPAENSEEGFPYIRCACAPANNIIQEFKYNFTDYNNTTKKVCPETEVATNSTGCATGTTQETAGFKYLKAKCLRKLKVNIICNLLHSSTGDTVHDSRTCNGNYEIDACCCDEETAVYALCGVAVFLLIIDAVFSTCVIFNCCSLEVEENKKWIVFSVVAVLLILGSLIGVIIVATSDSKLPDGDVTGCCDCSNLIGFAVVLGFFLLVGVILMIVIFYLIFKEKLQGGRGQQQTSNPLITCMTACKTAPACSAGDSGEEEKSSKKKKHGIQETGDATPTNKPRPQPEPPKGEHLQTKDPLPGIQGKKSSGTDPEYVPRRKLHPINPENE